MFQNLRIGKFFQNMEDHVKAQMFRILRLKGLMILIVSIGFGGYWMMQEHLDRSFTQLWSDLKVQWEFFSFSAAIKAAGLWVRKMGYYWVTREIPKRIAIGFALSYGVVYFLPLRKRIQFRDWAKRKKKLWTSRTKFLLTWLKRDDVFGPFAGWAIGLLITLIFLVLFYALFWVWIVIALGFLKMPWWISSAGRFFSQKLFFILQKIPFGKGLIKFTNVFWAYVTKWLSEMKIWKTKSEDKRRKQRLRQIRITRAVIRQRQAREIAWQKVCTKLLRTSKDDCKSSER
jgi:hypothetical protein